MTDHLNSTAGSTREALYVLPALRAGREDDGRFVLTRKFIEGVNEYAKRWPGPVVVCVQERDGTDTNLDQIAVDPAELSFEIDWLEDEDSAVAHQIRRARLVLASMVDRHVRMADICLRFGVPLAYISEYSLQTRRRIIRAETANPVLRLRREWWACQLERRFRRAIRMASGLQCNGTPVFEAYQQISPNVLLYFDSRVRTEMLGGEETIRANTGVA